MVCSFLSRVRSMNNLWCHQLQPAKVWNTPQVCITLPRVRQSRRAVRYKTQEGCTASHHIHSQECSFTPPWQSARRDEKDEGHRYHLKSNSTNTMVRGDSSSPKTIRSRVYLRGSEASERECPQRSLPHTSCEPHVSPADWSKKFPRLMPIAAFDKFLLPLKAAFWLYSWLPLAASTSINFPLGFQVLQRSSKDGCLIPCSHCIIELCWTGPGRNNGASAERFITVPLLFTPFS